LGRAPCNKYRDMVNAKTTHIGCGMASCPGDGGAIHNLYCLYGPGREGLYSQPFEWGEPPCTKCRETFQLNFNADGLCDPDQAAPLPPRYDNRVFFSYEEQKELVEKHNQLRIEAGGTAIKKIIEQWSEGAVRAATKAAVKCSPIEGSFSKIDDFGANSFISATRPSISDITTRWASERSNYNLETNTCNGTSCGAYTQMVWSNTLAVGCSMAKCSVIKGYDNCRGGYVVYCLYTPGGNIVGEKPYESGPIGSECKKYTDKQHQGNRWDKDASGLCEMQAN